MKTQIKLPGIILLILLWSGMQVFAQEEVTDNHIELSDTLSVMSMAAATSSSSAMYDNHFNISFISPDVMELMKYTDIPVDLVSGLPQIEIPLYTLECGKISLPITLSYHAGGITVDQVASWVGLGWSLNAGGAISCLPIDSKGSQNKTAYSLMNTREMEWYVNNIGFGGSRAELERWSTDKSVPDIFSYNFMGHSGKFFGYNGKAYNLRGERKLEFTSIYGYSRATDINGFRYEFDEREHSVTRFERLQYGVSSEYLWNHVTSGAANPYIYTYMLTKVVCPHSLDSLSFLYEDVEESYKGMTTGKLATRKGTWGNGQDHLGNYVAPYISSDTHCNSKKITEIKATNGARIEFIADHSRKDIIAYPGTTKPAPRALTQIKVYDPQNNLLKRWDFEYDYFESTVKHPYDEYANYRLKLTCLKEYGNNSTNPKIYRFNYYGEEEGEPILPFRGSFGGRDYLGYCNSQTNTSESRNINKSFPYATKAKPFLGNSYLPDDMVYGDGRDLNPHDNYAHAYSLKTLTYPTGGKREFVYEVHKNTLGHLLGGLRIKKIINHFEEDESTVQEYSYTGAYMNDQPKMFRKRTRDDFLWQLPIKTKDTTIYPIYEVSSSPLVSLPSYTGEGIKYLRVEETMADTRVLYEFYIAEGAFTPYYRSYRAIFQMDFTPGAWTPCWRIYNNNSVGYNDDIQYNRITWDYAYCHLKAKTTFVSDDLVIREGYDYDFIQLDTIPLIECSLGKKEWCPDDKLYYDLVVSDYITGRAVLTRKRTDYYSSESEASRGGRNDTPGKKRIEEFYGYNDYDLLTHIETINSQGEKEIIETLYACDINVSPYKEMKAQKLINYPIETIQKKNGNVVSGTLVTYKNFNGFYMPEKFYTLKTTTPLSSFTGYSNGTVNKKYGDPVAQIYQRNSRGQILHMLDREQVNIVYMWGYNYMYPVAEIKNATYSQLKAKVPDSEINSIATSTVLSDADWINLKSYKDDIPGSLVTVFTYKPLVGITSITDPTLETVYYDYDSFGRLKEIYRKKGGEKIPLERYEYNYRNK